jgi:hypothetical protein
MKRSPEKLKDKAFVDTLKKKYIVHNRMWPQVTRAHDHGPTLRKMW